MSEQTPSIGQIVHYTLTPTDAEVITRRRADNLGTHRGNPVSAGQVYPLLITRAWGDTPASAVNGQLLLDGNDVEWLSSRCAGEGEGHFTWPEWA